MLRSTLNVRVIWISEIFCSMTFQFKCATESVTRPRLYPTVEVKWKEANVVLNHYILDDIMPCSMMEQRM